MLAEANFATLPGNPSYRRTRVKLEDLLPLSFDGKA
jgi:hypothetical protein